MDTEEGDPMTAYRGGRRSCVVSALVRCLRYSFRYALVDQFSCMYGGILVD